MQRWINILGNILRFCVTVNVLITIVIYILAFTEPYGDKKTMVEFFSILSYLVFCLPRLFHVL